MKIRLLCKAEYIVFFCSDCRILFGDKFYVNMRHDNRERNGHVAEFRQCAIRTYHHQNKNIFIRVDYKSPGDFLLGNIYREPCKALSLEPSEWTSILGKHPSYKNHVNKAIMRYMYNYIKDPAGEERFVLVE